MIPATRTCPLDLWRLCLGLSAGLDGLKAEKVGCKLIL